MQASNLIFLFELSLFLLLFVQIHRIGSVYISPLVCAEQLAVNTTGDGSSQLRQETEPDVTNMEIYANDISTYKDFEGKIIGSNPLKFEEIGEECNGAKNREGKYDDDDGIFFILHQYTLPC